MKEIRKPHKSPYDTTASDRRSWALGYDGTLLRVTSDVETK